MHLSAEGGVITSRPEVIFGRGFRNLPIAGADTTEEYEYDFLALFLWEPGFCFSVPGAMDIRFFVRMAMFDSPCGMRLFLCAESDYFVRGAIFAVPVPHRYLLNIF